MVQWHCLIHSIGRTCVQKFKSPTATYYKKKRKKKRDFWSRAHGQSKIKLSLVHVFKSVVRFLLGNNMAGQVLKFLSQPREELKKFKIQQIVSYCIFIYSQIFFVYTL